MNIKVSVIIPCYNQAEYLEEAVQSVLQQSFIHWECIIVNDGSCDETEKIGKKLLAIDSRIKYIFQENTGLSGARNTGIRLSEGEYILPLDADDKIGADYLSEAIHILESRSDVKIVYCEAEKFGEKSGIWELPEFNHNEILLNNSIFCTAMYRRRDFNNTKGYNSSMKYGLEDWDFWLTLLKDGGTAYRIPKVHFYYRIRSKSMVRSISEEQHIFLRTQIFMNHIDLYISQFGDPISSYKKCIELTKSIESILNSTTYKTSYFFTKTFINLFIRAKNNLNRIRIKINNIRKEVH